MRRYSHSKHLTVALAATAALGLAGVAQAQIEYRTITGAGNNLAHPTQGASHTRMMRDTTIAYGDGISTMGGEDRPNPRAVSNAICVQGNLIPNTAGVSDFIWQWGQFMDHDLSLTEVMSPAEGMSIPVPAGDPFFDPTSTGTQVIVADRSLHDLESGTGVDNPRQQINLLTHYIDGSMVYGSDDDRARAIRRLGPSGLLKTSAGGLMPFNVDGLPNAGSSTNPTFFLAGEVRANEQLALTAMHTLWVREHNFWARLIRATFPHLTGEEIYQQARAIVIAEIQVITYREWLPAFLGPTALTPYTGYKPEVDATVSNYFANAAFRVGHTFLSPVLQRLNADGTSIVEGPVALRDAFFTPQRLVNEGNIAPILRGLAAQVAQQADVRVNDDVRNFLFGPPGAGGFDLPTLNVQRARDHGLPTYNQARIDMGLAPKTGFADVSSDPEVQQRLASVYENVDLIDPWIGGLAEDHVPGSLVGELIHTVMKRQFERSRDGDRFWYQRSFSLPAIQALEQTRLSDVIRRNTIIRNEIPDNVFYVSGHPNP